MKKFLLILIFTVPIVGISQNGIGNEYKIITVLDSLSNAPIEMVGVQFINTEKGVFSDNNGMIFIPLEIDSIKLQCLGYATKVFCMNQNINTILLTPSNIQLDEIIINDYNKFELLNDFKSKKTITFNSNTKGFIYARKFKGLKNSKILEVILDIENDSVEKNVLFALYTVKDNLPGKLVSTNNYLAKLKPNQKSITINTREDNLVLEDDQMYLTFTIVNSELIDNASMNIGVEPENEEYSRFKNYFSGNDSWQSLPKKNKSSFYNFNISVLLAR